MVWKVHWNPEKADANYRKHGVRFQEAEKIFRDPFLVVVGDAEHSHEEDRYFAIGESAPDRLLVGMHRPSAPGP